MYSKAVIRQSTVHLCKYGRPHGNYANYPTNYVCLMITTGIIVIIISTYMIMIATSGLL